MSVGVLLQAHKKDVRPALMQLVVHANPANSVEVLDIRPLAPSQHLHHLDHRDLEKIISLNAIDERQAARQGSQLLVKSLDQYSFAGITGNGNSHVVKS